MTFITAEMPNMLGPSLRWWKPHGTFGRPFRETQVDPSTPGQSRSTMGPLIQPNYTSQKIFDEKSVAKKLYHFGLVNKKCEAYTHSEPHHDAIFVVDMESVRRRRTSELHHPTPRLHDCVIKNAIYPGDKAETYVRTRSAVAHNPSNRTLTSTPWKKYICFQGKLHARSQNQFP